MRFQRLGQLSWPAILAILSMMVQYDSPAALERPLQRFRSARNLMGTSFKIVLYASDERTAKEGFERAFARVAELDRLLSHYRPDSEIGRLQQAARECRPVPVSPDLASVLQASLRLSRMSDGAFDVTAGPLTKLWRRALRRRRLPEPESLAQAAGAVGYRSLQLDFEWRTVQLSRPGMSLDLGGIAKGYAADQAVRCLRSLGIVRVLVDAGGDMALGDPPPSRAGWKIGLASMERGGPPRRFLRIANCGIATSGDTWQFVEIDGKRYSHILDPRTGMGISERRMVTVLASNCMLADGLASALSVMGPEAGMEMIDRIPGAAAVLVSLDSSSRMSEAESDEVRIYRSERFPP